jgi:hypothetical protein
LCTIRLEIFSQFRYEGKYSVSVSGMNNKWQTEYAINVFSQTAFSTVEHN